MNLSQNFVVTGESSEIETNFLFPVRLEDGFEIALSGFYSGPICNIDNRRDNLYLVKQGVSTSEVVQIRHNFYHTVGELLSELQRAINRFLKTKWGGKCELEFSVVRGVWTLQLPTHISVDHCQSRFDDVMNLFTTLEDGQYNVVKGPAGNFDVVGEKVLIYSSIVQESFINGRQSRLMAVLPLYKGKTSNEYEPQNLRFYKIAIEEFNSIYFEIRNVHGELVEFAARPHCDHEVEHVGSVSGSEQHNIVMSLCLQNLYKGV